MTKLKNWIKKPLAVVAVLGVCLGLALVACSDDTDHAASKLKHKTGSVVVAVADSEHLAK